ncbi:UTRA domain-containing protein [Brevibacterium sp. 5221]|uniref:UTRA domain-containing protein n=1 Tax=Brevibacterium rongguiense TaxID=2695267 RepID=A0A6N9H8L5_9MICO|nr:MULTISPECIES: GntR family transcriptional regulator [Brevibacterium]MYM20295.1 UTRA domain-containing protein [Brevibacterium rongguiense]WAL40166.1 GntR family transcriptional regulator [Brevibacterium sp. BRM-1]
MTTARELAHTLAAEVAQLPGGARIDSEHALMRRFGVGRSVVRAAVAELEARFLVRRVQGSGTYALRRIDLVLAHGAVPSFHGLIESAGASLRTRLSATAIEPLPAPVADVLGAPEAAPARRLLRTGEIDGLRAVLIDEWVTPGIAADVDAGLGVIESVCEILAAYGSRPECALTRASVEQPSALAAEHLGLDAAAPVWSVETHTVDAASGSPLLVSRAWLRLDSVRIVMELARA